MVMTSQMYHILFEPTKVTEWKIVKNETKKKNTKKRRKLCAK